MSALGLELAAAAVELIGEEGSPAVLRHRAVGPMSSGGDRAPTHPPSQTRGVLLPDRGDDEEEGVTHSRGVVYLLPVSPPPAPGDTVEVDGREFAVERAHNFAPAGVPVVSELRVIL